MSLYGRLVATHRILSVSWYVVSNSGHLCLLHRMTAAEVCLKNKILLRNTAASNRNREMSIFLSHLRHKQHAVGSQCADENGSSHSAVHQVGPGLQEDGHGDSHNRGERDQGDRCYDGGRLIDWWVAHVAGQPSQIGSIKEKTALKGNAGRKPRQKQKHDLNKQSFSLNG